MLSLQLLKTCTLVGTVMLKIKRNNVTIIILYDNYYNIILIINYERIKAETLRLDLPFTLQYIENNSIINPC